MATKERATRKPATTTDEDDVAPAKPRARGWGEGTIIERVNKKGEVTYLAQGWANGRRINKTHPTTD